MVIGESIFDRLSVPSVESELMDWWSSVWQGFCDRWWILSIKKKKSLTDRSIISLVSMTNGIGINPSIHRQLCPAMVMACSTTRSQRSEITGINSHHSTVYIPLALPCNEVQTKAAHSLSTLGWSICQPLVSSSVAIADWPGKAMACTPSHGRPRRM